MNQSEFNDFIQNALENTGCNENDDCNCSNNCSENSDKDYIQDNIVLLDVEDISGMPFDKQKFSEGIRGMSELCGQITALVNVGITPTLALSYLADRNASEKAADCNIKISEINANASVESSKFGMSTISKMSV